MAPVRIHRVLLVTGPFFPSVGGIESIVVNLANEFLAKGLTVTVATQEYSAKRDPFAFQVVRKPMPIRLWRLFTAADAIFQMGDGLRLGWPLFFRRFPIVTVHQIWQNAQEPKLRALLRHRIRRRSINVCPSRAMAIALDVPARIIGNPYDDKLFRSGTTNSRSRDIIFVGRLIPEKGVDILIEALTALRAREIRPSATIVGNGPEMGKLQELTIANGLAEQLNFVGAKGSEDVAALLRMHHVLVVPSRWEEPFGIVALEGLACGCIPIVSKSGGLPDAVGSAGLVFERNSSGELADRIVEALRRQSATRVTAEISAHLLQYTGSQVANRYLDLFSRNNGA